MAVNNMKAKKALSTGRETAVRNFRFVYRQLQFS